MASSDYTLHFNELTGEWDRVPYDSGQSSDVGTSGWYSTEAQGAGVLPPASPNNSAMIAAALVAGAILLAVLSGRH